MKPAVINYRERRSRIVSRAFRLSGRISGRPRILSRYCDRSKINLHSLNGFISTSAVVSEDMNSIFLLTREAQHLKCGPKRGDN